VRAALVALAIGPLAAGCGDEVPRGGVARGPATFDLSRKVEPTDLLPADLDLVVRVDLARLRSGLGPASLQALAARMPGDTLLRDALLAADAVTVGLRADDLEAGDRVVVVEGRLAPDAAMPDPERFTLRPQVVEQVRVWDRVADGASPRERVARVMRVGDQALVFVTAMEVDPTTRVLRAGPDELRGQPFAEGLVSLDWRPRPLRPSLARRFPSIAGVLRGLSRVRATASMGEAAIEVRAQLEAADEASATRVARFLELLRDNAGDAEAALLAPMKIERTGATVHLSCDIPAAFVLRAVAADRPGSDAPSPRATPPAPQPEP
jgi:hypothetical protein